MSVEHLRAPFSGFDLGADADGSDRLRQLHKRLVGRYHWAILLGLLGLMGGGIGGYLAIKPLYLDHGTVQISQHGDPSTKGDTIKAIESYITQQSGLLRSEKVISLAVESSTWQTLGRNTSPVDFADAIGVVYRPRGRNNELFEVSFIDTDPRSAHAGLTAVLEAYEQLYVADSDTELAKRIASQQRRLSDTKAQIRKFEQQIQHKVPRGMPALKSEQEKVNKEYFAAEELLVRLRTWMEEVRQREGDHSVAIETLVLQIAEIDSYMRNLVIRRDQARDLGDLLKAQGIGPQHTQMKKTQKLLAVATENVHEYAAKFDRSKLAVDDQFFPDDLEELEELERQYRQLVEENSGRAVDLARTVSDVEGLNRDLGVHYKLSDTIVAAIEDLETQAKGVQRVSIKSDGIKPEEPFNHGDRKKLAAVGGFVGFVSGFGFVVMLCSLDRRLRNSDDVMMTTGDDGLLGVLPTLPNNLADPDQAAIVAHCVHHIRALLQFAPGSEPRKVISVTSPTSGSGKTSLTLALGLSFAEAGDRTLLIDCDLFGGQLSARVNAIVKRRIGQILASSTEISEDQIDQALMQAAHEHKKIGQTLLELDLVSEDQLGAALDIQAQSRLGLLDALGGEDLHQCVAQTGFNNLSILSVGAAQPYDAGRLSPNSIRRLLSAARNRFDVVLIDTGPVPSSLEASLMAAESEGVVLTVARGEERPMAARAKRHLESIGATVLGVVFNRAGHRDLEPYSYRPHSISGDKQLGEAKRRNLSSRRDRQTNQFGPVAQAVSFYAPEGNGKSNGAGRNSTENRPT